MDGLAGFFWEYSYWRAYGEANRRDEPGFLDFVAAHPQSVYLLLVIGIAAYLFGTWRAREGRLVQAKAFLFLAIITDFLYCVGVYEVASELSVAFGFLGMIVGAATAWFAFQAFRSLPA